MLVEAGDAEVARVAEVLFDGDVVGIGAPRAQQWVPAVARPVVHPIDRIDAQARVDVVAQLAHERAHHRFRRVGAQQDLGREIEDDVGARQNVVIARAARDGLSPAAAGTESGRRLPGVDQLRAEIAAHRCVTDLRVELELHEAAGELLVDGVIARIAVVVGELLQRVQLTHGSRDIVREYIAESSPGGRHGVLEQVGRHVDRRAVVVQQEIELQFLQRLVAHLILRAEVQRADRAVEVVSRGQPDGLDLVGTGRTPRGRVAELNSRGVGVVESAREGRKTGERVAERDGRIARGAVEGRVAGVGLGPSLLTVCVGVAQVRRRLPGAQIQLEVLSESREPVVRGRVLVEQDALHGGVRAGGHEARGRAGRAGSSRTGADTGVSRIRDRLPGRARAEECFPSAVPGVLGIAGEVEVGDAVDGVARLVFERADQAVAHVVAREVVELGAIQHARAVVERDVVAVAVRAPPPGLVVLLLLG